MQGVRELVDGGRIQIELQAMTVASPAKMLSKGLHDALEGAACSRSVEEDLSPSGQ